MAKTMTANAKSSTRRKATSDSNRVRGIDGFSETSLGTAKGCKTFQNRELESSFAQFRQHLFQRAESESLQLRFKRQLSEKIELIGNLNFDEDDAEKQIMGQTLFGTALPDLSISRPTRSPDLPSYLNRLCETRLLLPEEETQLFRRMNYVKFLAIKNRNALTEENVSECKLRRIEALLGVANWYRDLIVQSNMRLVISIVKKFFNSHNAFDDLLSDGIMALMRAVDKFDYGRGFRFSTYATQVVRRNAYRTVMQKQKERLQISVSIHDPGMDVCERDQDSSISLERWNDLRKKLQLLLDQLDRRERLIVRARFSLGSHRNIKTLQLLADKLGVSKERVRQLEKRALERLRSMAEDVELHGMES